MKWGERALRSCSWIGSDRLDMSSGLLQCALKHPPPLSQRSCLRAWLRRGVKPFTPEDTAIHLRTLRCPFGRWAALGATCQPGVSVHVRPDVPGGAEVTSCRVCLGELGPRVLSGCCGIWAPGRFPRAREALDGAPSPTAERNWNESPTYVPPGGTTGTVCSTKVLLPSLACMHHDLDMSHACCAPTPFGTP